ncbi:Ykof family thiamine-binding protein [Mangrovibacillus cuniculi]|uniref:Thiamine-binding protein n=1 Tax=Mangrovibacillus cuniculi TaxID=2593652 RepID=A0A7S8C8T5_9BACI|nr:Ykof family thiamine-binding protein [Mangrovibacillus cuniculi]QPC45522.1 thiamine-binding protein [Mangrovibacillus cuniculi]
MTNQPVVCGTSRIVGCNISLHPMTDNFLNIILGTLEKVDTSRVWMKTDDVSTCIRGKAHHVFATAKAILAYASTHEVHVAFHATFSIGCPGDTAGDAYMEADDSVPNKEQVREVADSIYVGSQFALYPMNEPNYMGLIYDAIGTATKHGTYSQSKHYASRLDGSIEEVFHSLEQTFTETSEKTSHVVMTFHASVHSPSHSGNELEIRGSAHVK